MEPVNLFFSCDDNYTPFLSVTLISLKENRDPSRRYALRILHTGLCRESMERLETALGEPDFQLIFCDIRSRVQQFASQLHTRDYFSQSTYYRLFIPEMFPELDKALYLDSDLVVRGNIAELYDTELGSNLVGAVPDSFVGGVEELRQYVRNRLDISDVGRYFNAGILLMNLEAMRQFHFEEVFLNLLNAVTFQVAQDQDYLNTICRGRVTYVGHEWNTLPRGIAVRDPKLVHYNVDTKPWHCDDVRYASFFWEYANRCPFSREIRQIRDNYTPADTEKSVKETVDLIAMAHRQAQDTAENRRIHAQIAKVVGQ